ncbi:MAG: ArsR/SmtB family transcription factor [bacterium]
MISNTEGEKTPQQLFPAIADMLSALSHPIRLRILQLLSEKEHCVCEIVRALNLPQSLISQHLSILRAQGLVKAGRIGNRIFYSTTDERIRKLLKLAEEIVSGRLKEFSSLIGGE